MLSLDCRRRAEAAIIDGLLPARAGIAAARRAVHGDTCVRYMRELQNRLMGGPCESRHPTVDSRRCRPPDLRESTYGPSAPLRGEALLVFGSLTIALAMDWTIA